MKNIKFQHKPSQKLYHNYIKRIKKQIAILPKEDQLDLLMEFNSHIFEGLQKKKETSETEKLIDVLDKLGNPEDILKSTVAEKKLVQATKTFNPVHIFRALVLNIANGVSYLFFSILYIFLLAFGFLIFQKIINPTKVGLYFEKGKFAVLGKTSEPTATEMLGNWFIPVMIICAVTLYFIITLLLKLKQKVKK